MAVIKFTATKLAMTGKQGVLTPDSEGYYTMPVGGLNVDNSAGQRYTLDGARELFMDSSVFMRRVKNGNLKGELGHPKKLPGMSMDDFMTRILTVDETNVCAHFKEIWLDESFGKNRPDLRNPALVAIMAKVRPTGPKAQALQLGLENANENVCFSIRALTKDYYEGGKCYRILNTIMTFDFVTEPGISFATKWDSPSLESLVEVQTDERSIQRVAASPLMGVSTESAELAQECLKAVQVTKTLTKPRFSNW